MEAVYPVLSGALAQEKRLEVITNNLANAATAGYKKDLPVFEGLMTTAEGDVPLAGSGAEAVPVFGRLQRIITDFSSGAIRITGEPLDVAIEGAGFFAVQTPDGVRYTRNGHFTRDAAGRLATAAGFPVLGSGGPITLPAGTVSIAPDGRVSVSGGEAGTTPIEIDLIPLYYFPKPDALQKTGGSLFQAAPGSAAPAVGGRLRQGALEGSNVNPVEEMVAMIAVMRLYESAQKAIQTADDIAGKVSNEIGRIS